MVKVNTSIKTVVNTKAILLMAREKAKALRSTKTASLSIRASGRLTYPMEKAPSSLITYVFTKASS
jgi:hypothetical protein